MKRVGKFSLKYEKMKRNFLFSVAISALFAGSVLFSSCSKQEIVKEMSAKESVKSSCLLLQSDVIIDGVFGDLYQDMTGQQILITKESNLKTYNYKVTYELEWVVDAAGYHCCIPGASCTVSNGRVLLK